MKEILTEWRKFLLQERDTDVMYQELISFFSEYMLPNWEYYYDYITYDDSRFSKIFPNVFQGKMWTKRKKDRIPYEGPMSYTFEKNALIGLSIKPELVGTTLYEAFNKHKKQFRMTNPLSSGEGETSKKEIIKNKEDFTNLFTKLRIVLFSSQERPDAGADMGPSGIMRIYVNANQEFVKNALVGMKNMYPDIIKKWISSYINAPNMRRLISHEFGHFINSFRSGYKAIRTSGSGSETEKQYQPYLDDSHWYANSTEEIQARLVDITDELLSRFRSGDPKIFDLLKNKDFVSFKNDLLKTTRKQGHTFATELFYDKLSGKSGEAKKKTELPPLPKEILATLTPEMLADIPVSLGGKKPDSKLSLKKRTEIKRKVDNRLFDIYNKLRDILPPHLK